MKWRKETAWNLISECSRYRISKSLVNGEPIYTLWRCGTVPHVVLGTLEQCKAKAKEGL